MTPETAFRINTVPFAHQVIDGEVVIVNVEDGTYYSLRDTAADVWALLASGAGVQKIVEALRARYDADLAEIRAGVEYLLRDLLEEGIVSPDPEATAEAGDALPEAAEATRTPFVRPALERFTDMKDLLLLDPIHEGGDTGWPIVRYPEP